MKNSSPTVYRPSAKAVQKKLFDPRDRVIFYQGGKALRFREATLVEPTMNTADAKKYFVKVKELAPRQLNAFGRSTREITEKGLMLPVAVFSF